MRVSRHASSSQAAATKRTFHFLIQPDISCANDYIQRKSRAHTHLVLPYRLGFPMPALTAILIAYNEEVDLPRALASLQGVADETILVDSGSTDRTCEIARASGARVYSRNLDSLADQKNYASSFASNDWLLSI